MKMRQWLENSVRPTWIDQRNRWSLFAAQLTLHEHNLVGDVS